MNERQIRKIRNKFILISTLSFFGVILLMGGMIYAFSEVTLRNEVRQIMDAIIANNGELPVFDEASIANEPRSSPNAANGEPEDGGAVEVEAQSLPPTLEESVDISEEEMDARMEWSLRQLFGTGDLFQEASDYIRNTSYFAVLFDAEGNAERILTSNISELDEAQAVRYARIATMRHFSFGNFGRYYYGVSQRDGGGSIVIYVDRTGQVSVNHRILFAVLILLGFGTLLAFFLMRILSYRVVKGEIENAEKQKQFITNASHELKTPLAVIRANTEMQEMMAGETEWTASTMRQITRMSGLIENLVKIARADEMDSMELANLDVGRIVGETADSFAPVAEAEGKRLRKDIESPLEFVTDESMLRQLLTLLLDNAVKYCDADGSISCTARRAGKLLEITVSNSFAEGKGVDYSRFFDRFYRADSSHNEKGGYGIGLSIAESIAKSLRGELDVTWKDGIITFRAALKEQKR